MSLRLLVYILTFAAIVFTMFFVYLNNRRSMQNITFAAFLLCVASWVLSLVFADNSSSLMVVSFASRWAYVSAVLMLLSLLYFSYIFPNSNFRVSKKILLAFGIPSIVMLVFTPSKYLIENVKIESYGANVITGPLYYIFFVYFLVYLTLSIYNFINSNRKAKGVEKRQVQFLLYGILVSAVIAAITNLVLVFVGISSLGYLGPPALLIFIGLTAYAMVRHSLFDIRALVSRSVAYILSIMVIAAVYAIVAFRLTNAFVSNFSLGIQQTFYVILAIVLAFTFSPLQKFFKKISNKIFYRDSYDTQMLINNIGRVLASEIDLDNLSKKVIKILVDNLKIEKAEIVVFGKKQMFYESNSFKYLGSNITQKELENFGRTNLFIDNIASGERKDVMQKFSINASIALHTSEQFIGYLLLSEKKSGDIFSDDDIRLLKIIGSELSVAIQNALSYKEIQLFSETLAEKVQQRTAQLRNANNQLRELDQAKDEFISMASHQLRTPLTTVKGYTSMLEEGEFGKLTSKQKEPVILALDGANRMARLIDDLLNVSRMDANRFFLEISEVDLAKVVKEELQQLQTLSKNKNVNLSYKPPSQKIPLIRLDENKTRQVVMNLVDNAIHYSQPPKGGGEVKVSLGLENENVVFKVIDNGIGVPIAEQKKLFTKMFRANNAKELRPDGTGLGLYLVKRVISDEGGEIIFQSQPGRGSLFGFMLPLSGVPKEMEQASKKISAKVAASHK